MRRAHLKLIVFCLIVLAPSLRALQQPSEIQLKKEVIEFVDNKNELLIKASDKIWEYAEIALLEYESSRLLEGILESEGFAVEKDVAGLPTAFVATCGSGSPVIGILAEYYALPGLSQDDKPYKQVLQEEGAGHGCGHNLFGAGSLGAALGLKAVMDRHNLKGTLRLYGCPAEEDVGGKLYMARDGLLMTWMCVWRGIRVTRPPWMWMAVKP